jgi:hypothetical protein
MTMARYWARALPRFDMPRFGNAEEYFGPEKMIISENDENVS